MNQQRNERNDGREKGKGENDKEGRRNQGMKKKHEESEGRKQGK